MKLWLESIARSKSAGESDIALRPFHPGDALHLHAATLESLQPLCQWMTWCHTGYSLQDCQSFIRRAEAEWIDGDSYYFAILLPQRNLLAGSIGLRRVEPSHGCANLGYWVRTSQTRQGIASRAVRLVARYAFDQLKLRRLEIVVPEGNHASRRVAEEAGARFEGLLRKKVILHNQFHEARMYSLISEDLPAI